MGNIFTRSFILLLILNSNVQALESSENSTISKKRHFLCTIEESQNDIKEAKNESIIVAMTGSSSKYKIKNSKESLVFQITPKGTDDYLFSIKSNGKDLNINIDKKIDRSIKELKQDFSAMNKNKSSLDFSVTCNKVRYMKIDWDREGSGESSDHKEVNSTGRGLIKDSSEIISNDSENKNSPVKHE